MTNEQITAKIHSVSNPEPLSNGGKKWFINLDNGSQVITYTYKLANGLSEYVGSEFIFECEAPPFDGASPKAAKVFWPTGELFWEPAPKPTSFPQGGASMPQEGSQAPARASTNGAQGSWVDTSPAQNARHAMGCASALMSSYLEHHPDMSWDDAVGKSMEAAMDFASTIDGLWHNLPQKTKVEVVPDQPQKASW